VIHFVNVMVFSSMRRRSRHDATRAQWMQQTQPYGPPMPRP